MKYREVGFCPSHEDKTNDESADFSSTDESQFGCEENPDQCPTQQHQCKTVVSSVQSNSYSGPLSHSVDQSQVVVCLAQKKKHMIPLLCIVMHHQMFYGTVPAGEVCGLC